MNAKELRKGFSYSVKEEHFIYIGRTRFLGETDTLALKMIEEHLFYDPNTKEKPIQPIPLKQLKSSGTYSISEEEADALFQSYVLVRQQNHLSTSNEVHVEMAKFLMNPIVSKYIQQQKFKTSTEVFQHMQKVLSDFFNENTQFVIYQHYVSKKDAFHQEVIGAYLSLLLNLKHFLLSDVDTNKLSKKKIETLLFTKSIQNKLIHWVEEEITRYDESTVKELPFSFKFSKNWLVKSELVQHDFLKAYEENKDNTIDFSKGYEENHTSLLKAVAFNGSNYHLYQLKTLFGDLFYLFCNIRYLNNLEHLQETIFNETIYKN